MVVSLVERRKLSQIRLPRAQHRSGPEGWPGMDKAAKIGPQLYKSGPRYFGIMLSPADHLSVINAYSSKSVSSALVSLSWTCRLFTVGY